jgi:hypothetical protein
MTAAHTMGLMRPWGHVRRGQEVILMAGHAFGFWRAAQRRLTLNAVNGTTVGWIAFPVLTHGHSLREEPVRKASPGHCVR